MPDRLLVSALPQHEAAELYRLMVEGIQDCAVFLMDPHGIITVWNKAAEKMKGYTPEEAIGSHLGLLYTDEDRAAGHPEHNLRIAAKEGFFNEERWRKRKDGSLFWAHISLTALRGERGELLGFSKITMDLTRHRLLEQCEKEKAEIDFILRTAESGTWRWDVVGGEVEVSQHLLQLLGYAPEERRFKLDSWLALFHPDDRPAMEERVREVRSNACSVPLETEARLLHRDGSAHWFYLRANWNIPRDDTLCGPPIFLGACVAIDTIKQADAERTRLYRELEQERARFANILEQLPSAVVLAEAPSGKLVYQNRVARDLLGRGIEQIASASDYAHYRFVAPNGERIRAAALPLARAVGGEPGVRNQQMIYERADGTRLHLATTTARVEDSDGVARLAVAVLHDVSDLKRAELMAATERERAQVTLAAITDSVVTTDRDGRISTMNPAAERLTGWPEAEARGQPFLEVMRFSENSSADNLLAAVSRCLAERGVIADLPYATLMSRDGQRYSVENAVASIALAGGELIGTVLIFHDVTESKRLIRRLGFEASHDALTGLVNRREFEVRLQRALERAHGPHADPSALLYIDLDQFKVVNDTCGHSAGDELLRMLAESFSSHVRERDTLARIGGDEFALIIEHCEVDEALAVADKILEATRSFRYSCKGRMFQLGVSIGLAPVDRGTASVEEAMRRADHACYIAKERGRNRVYAHYHGDIDIAQRRSDMHWVTRLSHAFQHDELQLYCQPIMSLGQGEQRMHYEILLRLKNGRSAVIGPGSFLPAAERYDVIHKIDRWVLTRTLEWLAAHAEHTAALEMCSINLSRRSLADQSFHAFAADLIDRSAVPAGKLCFEITENGAIADMNKTIAFIEALSKRGCRFSLDDFGTGMTSFSYLKQLPVNFIKIDGSFIQMMSSSEVDFEMVRFTNDISHMMGRQTIAEYVTDQAILANLRDIGVDFAQGYWVGKPRPLTV